MAYKRKMTDEQLAQTIVARKHKGWAFSGEKAQSAYYKDKAAIVEEVKKLTRVEIEAKYAAWLY